MSISYQAKDVQVLSNQLKVQEIVVYANDPLVSVSGSDLLVQINEPIAQAIMAIKQVAAGTLTGVVPAVSGSTSILLTGESAAVSTTRYLIKYSVSE